MEERGEAGRGGAYSFVACLSHLTIDHASLSRRTTDLGDGKGGVYAIMHVRSRMAIDLRIPTMK